MNAPPVTVLDVNAELNTRIGTAEPLFRAQHYYQHRNDACGCDTEYPTGAFDATIEAIHDITGIPQRALVWAIHDAWEHGQQVRSDHHARLDVRTLPVYTAGTPRSGGDSPLT